MAEKPTPGATSSIEDQIRLREEKARDLRARGQHPYGNDAQVGTTTEHVREVHGADTAEELEKEHTPAYSIAGRVMAIRTMGKVTFLSLRDRTGDLQAFIKKDKVGEPAYEALKLLDLGDIAWVRGRAMRTKTGELSIEAEQGGFRLLTKALRPLPEKWHGLTDAETLFKEIPGISFCYFTEVDVVRHPLVQAIIRAYDRRSAAQAAASASAPPRPASPPADEPPPA